MCRNGKMNNAWENREKLRNTGDKLMKVFESELLYDIIL